LQIKDIVDDDHRTSIKEIVFGPMDGDDSKMFAVIDDNGRLGLFKFITNKYDNLNQH
jgi:hypothetical protein